MLSRGHWDSAGLLTLGEMAAGWHRACSPTPRGRRDTEGLRAPGAHSLPTAGTSQRCKFHFSPCKRIQGAKAASPGTKPPPPPRRAPLDPPAWAPGLGTGASQSHFLLPNLRFSLFPGGPWLPAGSGVLEAAGEGCGRHWPGAPGERRPFLAGP